MKIEKSVLYLVPTPVGNLGDITYRAIEVLKNVDLIAAEDTRTSQILLQHFEIKTSLRSYHKFNEKKRCAAFMEMLKAGKSIAVISDAGSPGISDPSNILVKSAVENGIKVSALPGATAFVPALTASGFSTDSFYFCGFLSDKPNDMQRQLEELEKIKAPSVYYVSPHKMLKTANAMYKVFGNRKFVAAREISKIYETYFRGELKSYLDNPDSIRLKGEFVVIVEGKKHEEISDKEIIGRIKILMLRGYSKSKAVKLTAKELTISKNRVYDLSLEL